MRLDGYLFCNIMYNNNYVLFSVIVVHFFLFFYLSIFCIVYCKNCSSVIKGVIPIAYYYHVSSEENTAHRPLLNLYRCSALWRVQSQVFQLKGR